MIKIFHIFAILLLIQLPTHAQQQVNVSQSTYNYLSDSVSLTNGQVWDDEQYLASIGFPFYFGDSAYTSVWLSANGFVSFPGQNNSIIRAFHADLFDRGSSTSPADIRTKLTGQPGNRIRKFEWRNAGFYNGSYNDFVNFQLWLHETSNAVTIHIGHWHIDTIVNAFDGQTGPGVGLIYKSFNGNPNYYGYMLSGNPAIPNTHQSYGASTPYFLDGIPAAGATFHFYYSVTEASLELAEKEWIIYPNPTSQFLNINSSGTGDEPFTVSVFTVQGQRILRQVFSNSSQGKLDVKDLATGTYFVEVVQGEQVHYSRISKE